MHMKKRLTLILMLGLTLALGFGCAATCSAVRNAKKDLCRNIRWCSAGLTNRLASQSRDSAFLGPASQSWVRHASRTASRTSL